MEYYFNNLNPNSFQRLINGLLLARFGEDARLTPLRGADGGRDAETAPANPFYEYQVTTPEQKTFRTSPRPGRYLFQVKHHRTIDTRPSDARNSVLADFAKELKANVLTRKDEERVNYFFLITNVPSSKDSILAVDQKRRELLQGFPNLHADVWWQEGVMALLDQNPSLWTSFPEMFAGGKVPFLADVVNKATGGMPRAIRVAIGSQYQRDSLIKFKQIELEKSLMKLFVDLDVDLRFLDPQESEPLVIDDINKKSGVESELGDGLHYYPRFYHRELPLVSALGVLLSENTASTRKILLEGGPGQGKSTITQMMTQIYRSEVLLRNDLNPEGRWSIPEKKRLPLRMELRLFAEWLGDHVEGSAEEYLAELLQRDSGGSQVMVDDIHSMVEHSPVLLVFDGLDEVGSADLRDSVLLKIAECVDRFETTLHTDLRVIVTTRPPAIAGRREQLTDFRRFPIAPMEQRTVKHYLERWLAVQVHEQHERLEVRESFERRQNETHVAALAKNPMQLSVLLHFIRLKGEAFPDRRAELYRDYFRTVIDRDVEKSPELRQKREVIETLHELLGYKIHLLTEADKADGTLRRPQLLEIVKHWMNAQVTNAASAADEILRIGEERLGLIVALRGEGEEAKYGFEIQPIREYFAAAYINEQIQGNAHDVFESLIYRAYWKEVALFLAGLRRPNEKADLITRAKVVERNPEIGWRHDGRVIVLQLLQEGVFSQPRHVFSEAVDFIIDVLDPNLVSAPSEPKDALEVLPGLIQQSEKEQHMDRLLRIADNYRANDDAQANYRIYTILSSLIEPDKLKKLLLSYEGTQPDVLVWFRLYWPCLWGVSMRAEAEQPEFWKALSEEYAATYLWKAALLSDLATAMALPRSVHSQLFERYALSPQSILEQSLSEQVSVMEPQSNHVIWRFLSLQQSLFSAALGIKPPTMTNPRASEVDDTNFDGLDPQISAMLQTLIPLLKALAVAASDDNEETLSKILDEYVSVVTHFLDFVGIAGLVACRTGMYLIELYRMAMPRRKQNSIMLKVLKSQGSLTKMSLGLMPYFGIDKPTSSNNAFSFLFHRIHESGPVPTHVRLESEGSFVSIAELLASNILGEDVPLFPSVKRIPITSSHLRPLVDHCRTNLKQLLKTLSSRSFEPDRFGRPLIVQNTQRILKLARSTRSANISEGALVALSSSKFLNLAGRDLTLKMVASALTKLSVAQRLFSARRQDSRESNVLLETARSILRNPSDFQVGLGVAAASFLSEHLSIRYSPLITLEAELGLHFQQPGPTGKSTGDRTDE